MKEGLMWFDNDPDRNLSDKIRQAAVRYQAKFGQKPTACYLNEVDFEGQSDSCNGIRLLPSRSVLRHHLWIGVDSSATVPRAA